MTTSALTRNRADGLIGGVCAGLAAHLGLPASWVRVAMVAFALLGGAGVLFYIWLWVLAPDSEPGALAPMRRALMAPERPASSSGAKPTQTPATETDRLVERARRFPIAELLLGACLLVAGVGLVLVQLGVQLRLDIMLPALAVLAGVGLTWWQIADLKRPERNVLPRVIGALALVAVGVLMFFVTAGQPNTMTIVGAALAVLAGVALALAPWALRVNRELLAERAARAREAERAEIAAHLHDSVLQSLAAIQQRSAPGSEVARIARSQERELREWLFRSADGEVPTSQDSVEAELQTHAVALEAVHEVRFEVVAVGGDRSAPEPIVAAAREAMLNAAKHAGGEVIVYAEITPTLVSIDITDRGTGVDLEALPEGRIGVRESIIGRMRRAGGEARFTAGPGGSGTAVRLSLPLGTSHEQPQGEEVGT